MLKPPRELPFKVLYLITFTLLVFLLRFQQPYQVQFMPRIILLTDFDETLTHNDTTPILARAAYALRPENDQPTHPWEWYEKMWVDDFAIVSASFPSETRKSFQDEEKFAGLVRGVEEASLRRVEDGGVFHGMQHKKLIREAYKNNGCMMRSGWRDVFDKVSRQGGRTAIISAGWSREWIEYCLGKPEDVEVYANEMLTGPDDKLTGYINRTGLNGGGLWNSIDKRDYVRWIVGQEKQKGNEVLVIYVGDSPMDLFAIYEADLGLLGKAFQRGLMELQGRGRDHCLRLRNGRKLENGLILSKDDHYGDKICGEHPGL
ncbi:HAD-like domain-containing protein [Tuber borchii]|uniref:HAD-like domain-containing protein n=1 Tax=Tuber borchii TaxID=42251 RepID=A0A2T6ZCY3_TUBBO|nr:HAD-like domain-containing protein [Tuber borchii]